VAIPSVYLRFSQVPARTFEGDSHAISPQTMRSATAEGGSWRVAVCALARNDIFINIC